ncbi:MAG: NAD(P)-dependent oxidoreductase, partial [Myxococcota bacterium]|nr:NAD(P)-dependent oxidoreductase [Myxococcota bacterium]
MPPSYHVAALVVVAVGRTVAVPCGGTGFSAGAVVCGGRLVAVSGPGAAPWRRSGERDAAVDGRSALPRTFPAHLIVEGRRCVVVGGGRAAVRRVERLLEGGASVVVVAQEVEPRIQALADRGDVDLRRRAFEPSDAAGAAYVFSTVGLDPRFGHGVPSAGVAA